jgi:hypothetical protein
LLLLDHAAKKGKPVAVSVPVPAAWFKSHGKADAILAWAQAIKAATPEPAPAPKVEAAPKPEVAAKGGKGISISFGKSKPTMAVAAVSKPVVAVAAVTKPTISISKSTMVKPTISLGKGRKLAKFVGATVAAAPSAGKGFTMPTISFSKPTISIGKGAMAKAAPAPAVEAKPAVEAVAEPVAAAVEEPAANAAPAKVFAGKGFSISFSKSKPAISKGFSMPMFSIGKGAMAKAAPAPKVEAKPAVEVEAKPMAAAVEKAAVVAVAVNAAPATKTMGKGFSISKPTITISKPTITMPKISLGKGH